MKEFERKKKVKSILYSRTSIFILCVILVLLARATWNVAKKEHVARRNLQKVEDETARLDEREAQLRQRIGYLETDEGIEAEIRQKFRAVKADEHVAIIVREERRQDIHLEPETTLFDRILEFFGIK